MQQPVDTPTNRAEAMDTVDNLLHMASTQRSNGNRDEAFELDQQAILLSQQYDLA